MIKLLPEDVWSKIAAGEVVERPGSVVKELVENSIDVGAKRIRVSLWDGGKARIIVEDDGGGIPFDDLPLAIERHATSKLSTTEDLNSIITLGYRGEAIASIASVSKLEIRSCPEGEAGGLIRVNEGRLIEHVKTTCPKGARVQVDDLFCNIPARKKFLKASLSELRRCSSVLRDYALAWPGISFGLSHENKTLYTTDGNGNRKRALSQIWGNSPESLTVHVTSGNLSLECWYQPFPLRGRNEISAFVNGRAVNDPIIRAAVSNAGNELSGNWALFITLNPSLIDVNVHPAKAEIRFRYTGEVFDSIKKASEILSGNPAKIAFFNTPKYDGNSKAPEVKPKPEDRSSLNFSINSPNLFSRAASSFDTESFTANESSEKSWNFNEDDLADKGNVKQNINEPEVKFISQLSSGYLVFETPESVIIMDPHAAHERIMFEKIMVESAQVKTQTLISPEALQPTIAVQVQELESELCSVGFSFSDENGLCVTGIPFALGNVSSPLAILRATIAVWSDNGNERKLDEQLTARWSEIACKSSVKLTSRLHQSEALELWRKLHLCKQPFSCPHGRPTVLKLEYSELAKHFGR
ncbi:MAG: DNA mismatch repair endonuclease MutL [Synergistaceae bacterium]|nr:DNA mismatch repair endonuclease MutL [Synergistaceae bacterium]